MRKHIVPPATAEEIKRSLGVTPEDEEIVARVLEELEAEDEEFPYSPDPTLDAGETRYLLSKKHE